MGSEIPLSSAEYLQTEKWTTYPAPRRIPGRVSIGVKNRVCQNGHARETNKYGVWASPGLNTRRNTTRKHHVQERKKRPTWDTSWDQCPIHRIPLPNKLEDREAPSTSKEGKFCVGCEEGCNQSVRRHHNPQRNHNQIHDERTSIACPNFEGAQDKVTRWMYQQTICAKVEQRHKHCEGEINLCATKPTSLSLDSSCRTYKSQNSSPPNMKDMSNTHASLVYKHSNQTNNAIGEGGEIVVKEGLHRMPQIFPHVKDFVDDIYEGIQRKQIDHVILKNLQMTSDSYVGDPIEHNICKLNEVEYKLKALGRNHIMGSDTINSWQHIPQNVSKVVPKPSNLDNDLVVTNGHNVHGKTDEVPRNLEENDVTFVNYEEELYATIGLKDGAKTQGCIDANARLLKPQTFMGNITIPKLQIQEILNKEIKDDEPNILEGVKVLTSEEDVKRIDAKISTTNEPNVHKQTTHEISNRVVDGNRCQQQNTDNIERSLYITCANQDDNYREATSPNKFADIFEKHDEFLTMGGFKMQPKIDIPDKDMQHEQTKDRLGRRKKWSTSVELLKDANLCCLQYANKDDIDEQGEDDEENVKDMCEVIQDLQTQMVFTNTTISSNLQNKISDNTHQILFESTSRRNKNSFKMCDMDCDSGNDGLSIPKQIMYEKTQELVNESHHKPIAQLERKTKDVERKEENSMRIIFGSALSKKHANLDGELMLQVMQKEPTMDKKIVLNTNRFIKQDKIDQRHINESKKHEMHFGFKRISEVCDTMRSRPKPLMTIVGGSRTHKICERQMIQQLKSYAYSRNMHDRPTVLYVVDDDESKIHIDKCTQESTHVILNDKHLSPQVAKQGHEGLRNLTNLCNKDDGVPTTLVVKELIDVRFYEVGCQVDPLQQISCKSHGVLDKQTSCNLCDAPLFVGGNQAMIVHEAKVEENEAINESLSNSCEVDKRNCHECMSKNKLYIANPSNMLQELENVPTTTKKPIHDNNREKHFFEPNMTKKVIKFYSMSQNDGQILRTKGKENNNKSTRKYEDIVGMTNHMTKMKDGIKGHSNMQGCQQYGVQDFPHEHNENSSMVRYPRSITSDFIHFLRQLRCAKHLWSKINNVINSNFHPRQTNELHMCVENDELLDKIEKMYTLNLRSKKNRKRFATRNFYSATPHNPKLAKHCFANVDSSIIPQDTGHGISKFIKDFITKMGDFEKPRSSLSNIEVEKHGFDIKDHTNDKLLVVRPNWLRNKKHENLKVHYQTYCYTLNTCTFVVPRMHSSYKEGSKKRNNHKGKNIIILVKPNLERQVVDLMHKRRFRKILGSASKQDKKGEPNLWTQFISWCRRTLRRRVQTKCTNPNNVISSNLDDSNGKKDSNVTSWSHASRFLKKIRLSRRSPKQWFFQGCKSKTIGLLISEANPKMVCGEGKSQRPKTNGDMCATRQILLKVKDRKKMEVEAKKSSPRADNKPRFLWMHSRATHLLEAPSRLHGRLFRKAHGVENIQSKAKSTLEVPTSPMSKRLSSRRASHKEHANEVSNKSNVSGNSEDACKVIKWRKIGRLQRIFIQKNDSQGHKSDLQRTEAEIQSGLHLMSTPPLVTSSVERPMFTKPQPKSSFDSKKPFWKNNHQRMKWSLPRLTVMQPDYLSTSKTIVRDNVCWDMDAQLPRCADNLHVKSLVRNPQKFQKNGRNCLEVRQTLTRRDFIWGTCDPGLRSLVQEDNLSMHHVKYKPFNPSTSR